MPVSSRNTNAVLLRLFSFDGVDVRVFKSLFTLWFTGAGGGGAGELLQRVDMTHFSKLVGGGSKPAAQTVDVSSGADDEGGARVDDGLAAAGAAHCLTVDFHAARERGISKARVPSVTNSSILPSGSRKPFFCLIKNRVLFPLGFFPQNISIFAL